MNVKNKCKIREDLNSRPELRYNLWDNVKLQIIKIN
jgi:hypothetical protein